MAMIEPKDGVIVEFEVPGDPVGYLAAARRNTRVNEADRPRVEKFNAYAEKVRIFGLQAQLQLPLFNSRTLLALIDVYCFFASGRHPDPGNVQKGIVDALCYTSNDRFTGGFVLPPFYDEANPRVEICIEWFSPERLTKTFDVFRK